MQVGSVVDVLPGPRRGTIEFIGNVEGLSSGTWYGISLEEKLGKNDGSLNGVRYFDAKENHGIFTQRKNLRNIMEKSSLHEKFSIVDQTRKLDREKRGNEKNELLDPSESTNGFWEKFNEQHDEIKETLLKIREKSPNSAVERTAITSSLDDLIQTVGNLREMAANASFFLPPYDMRQTQNTIQTLLEEISTTRSQLVPRKKFAFSTASHQKKSFERKGNPINTTNNNTTTDNNNTGTMKDNNNQQLENQNVDLSQTLMDRTKLVSFTKSDELTFSMLENQVLTITEEGKDLNFKELKNCVVCITTTTNAIRCNQLTNCSVYSGPVQGSILLQNCQDCVFVVATRQIRIHHTFSSEFYIRTTSHPIIEDCNHLKFSNYCLMYKGLKEELENAQMGKENGLWKQVKDFKWHRIQPSPHWEVMDNAKQTIQVDERLRDLVSIVNSRE